MTIDLHQPFRLSVNNFAPLHRTPWAGTYISRTLKSAQVKDNADLVGEAWEFSCDPSLPSGLDGESRPTIMELIKQDPRGMLGPNREECEILVKVLCTSSPLSLQIHPADDDPKLAEHECGKPECWYILEAEQGAGLYLGYREPLSKDSLKLLLESGDSIESYLQFVPVKPGDYFEIAPGVPHAIGPGLALIEPQRVRQGFSGKTFRMWDWGRKFDTQGQLDLENGAPRELHVDASLRLTDPETQFGEAFLDTCRRLPKIVEGDFGCLKSFPPNSYCQFHFLELGAGESFALPDSAEFAIWITISGAGRAGDVPFTQGQSLFFPAQSLPQKVTAEGATSAALVTPNTGSLV